MPKELLLPLERTLKSGIEEAVERGGYTEEGIYDVFRALGISINLASTLATAPSRHTREMLSFNIYKGLSKFPESPCRETFEDIKTAGKVDRIDTSDKDLRRILDNYANFIKRMSVKFGRKYHAQMRYGSSREEALLDHKRQVVKDMMAVWKTRELALMRLRDGHAYPLPEEGVPPELYVDSMRILPKEPSLN